MQKHGIAAKQKKRYKRTPKANDAHPIAPNLLNRDFTAVASNQKWTVDVTYIPTTESFFGTLKMEHVHHVTDETRAEARTDIFFYIEVFYNRECRHSTLGYVSPEAFEAAWYQHQSALTDCP